jgi:hypothetical protein
MLAIAVGGAKYVTRDTQGLRLDFIGLVAVHESSEMINIIGVSRALSNFSRQDAGEERVLAGGEMDEMGCQSCWRRRCQGRKTWRREVLRKVFENVSHVDISCGLRHGGRQHVLIVPHTL